MFDLKFLSHYPFLSEAKKYVQDLEIEIDESILELGKKRLQDGLSTGLKPILELDEQSFKNSILSYAASRLILSNWKNIYIRQRMAIAESKLARYYLQQENLENLENIAKEFEISFRSEEKGSKIKTDVVSYLKYSPKDIHYKLIYMPLKKGEIYLSKEQFIRVLEEAIRTKLEVIPLPTISSNSINKIIKELNNFIPKQNLEQIKINTTDFPPCIKKLIAQLSSSINVSHYGRVALAIYLIKAGYSNEQIFKIFSLAPDYNPEITSYQIEFIRKKGYNMPSCATMESSGLCIAECKCSNPTLFRRKVHAYNAKKSVLPEDEEYVKY